jgi:hypothetical protein
MWGLIWLWKGLNQEGEGINVGDGWPWSLPLTNKIEKFLTFLFQGTNVNLFSSSISNNGFFIFSIFELFTTKS